MALVDSTDKLYIFSDTGWYSISIVNTTPSIAALARLTLLLQMAPLLQSRLLLLTQRVSRSLCVLWCDVGNIATVSQGTGSNTNQWTITPSANTANAAVSLWYLEPVMGQMWRRQALRLHYCSQSSDSNYTTALITSVGANNAVNNSDDASTNNHDYRNGNVTQNTFSPIDMAGIRLILMGQVTTYNYQLIAGVW